MRWWLWLPICTYVVSYVVVCYYFEPQVVQLLEQASQGPSYPGQQEAVSQAKAMLQSMLAVQR
jgi:hypothetical protein